MEDRILMKGNDAVAQGAIDAGCRYYFGYPITPQTEISHYMAEHLPRAGGVFIQAESEIAAINMVYGASSAGARSMTSSSSPGISLKQEGLSYIAGAELPAVVVNVVRCGPGLGGILPAQCDYFQSVKGGGHGDYRNIVLAPNSVQEIYDLTREAFDLADKYRITVMVMADGSLGQMMESVTLKQNKPPLEFQKPWATTGTGMKRPQNVVTSVYIIPEELEEVNNRLQAKYREIEKNEVRWEEINCQDAKLIVCSYGTTSRIMINVIQQAKQEGIEVGLIRPITLWPFPYDVLEKYTDTAEAFLSLELSAGQMVEDVKLGTKFKRPVHFYGRTGGMIPTQGEILKEIRRILGKGGE
ncbi:MAG: 3-methyl-2-oxobutanoate dehydrogenase subunit VorB [Clostridia bacterium]